MSLLFGVNSNVEDPAINDPRNPFIDTTDIYKRTEPNTGTWEIAAAKVETMPIVLIFNIKYPGIILDDDSGEKVDLVCLFYYKNSNSENPSNVSKTASMLARITA